MDNKIEVMWRTYSSINDWIQSSNTKAEIVLGIHGIMITVFLTSNLFELQKYLLAHKVILGFVILMVATSAISIAYAFFCITPRLEVGAPQSLIYFSHISKNYSHAPSYERAVRDNLSDQNQLLREISSQVWANAVVADRKFKYISLSIRFLAINVILGIFAIISVLFI
ncbi:MAG: hypothetical protein H6657_22270 [Ardenticatenaceae bacterium]|nr:hypothetical protein [Ardenticatenaceae bacterium]